jgi:hypothetical protein
MTWVDGLYLCKFRWQVQHKLFIPFLSDTFSSKLSGSVAKLGNLTACPYLDMESPIGELSIQKRIELLLVNIPSLEDLIHHAEDWITTFRGGAAVLLGK